MRAFTSVVLAVALAAVSLTSAGAETEPCDGVVCASFSRRDVTWHVPGAQGQYSDSGNAVIDDRFDPYVHNVHTKPQDGLHSRSYARAFVVQGPDGKRVAYVGHDLYLQQDTLTRRVAQLVEEADIGIDRESLMIQATHNHSATYLSSISWGVWVFTDAYDARFFDFLARQLADAVIDAAQDLRPVKVGASVTRFDAVQQNILGPRIADDGTPAGFPRDHFDDELAVVRFDDAETDEPMGMLVNLGMHPESLDHTGMPSADFVGQVEKMVSRDTGAAVVWSQGAVGDVEPDRDARANPPEEKHEYWHRDFSQMEKMSRIVADAVTDTWSDVAAGTPDVADRYVPPATSFPVDMLAMRFAGPASHPVPTVSNCRTEAAAGGQPGIPVLGFPDCARVPGPDLTPVYEGAEKLAPIPANYGAPGYTGAHEALNIHLQVMRLGEIVLATCPCEPVSDMAMNFKSRTDLDTGDLYNGFEWPCRPAGDGYECDYAHTDWRPDDWRPVDAEKYERMMAQIRNDAKGWDDEDPEAILEAEHEPADPSEIKGNFTHEEIQDLGAGGYTLPLMVGQANDYIGYVVTYRDHQEGDHYRKALTAFGPHSADYINTRLVKMAAILDGADLDLSELGDVTVTAEDAFAEARARALGEEAAAHAEAYEAILPEDGGEAEIVIQPGDIERFDGAQVRWYGGNHYVDNPRVSVEGWAHTCHDGDEQPVPCEARPVSFDQDGGEVVVNLAYEQLSDPQASVDWATGEHRTLWTATWEAFDDIPVGEYRFVIRGDRREAGATVPYELTSEPFDVRPWDGIEPIEGAFDPATGEASFAVAPIDYPDSYDAVGVPYLSTEISETPTGDYCLRCTFRPWTDTGEVASARVTVIPAHDVEVRHVPAVFDPATGRFTATVDVAPDDGVLVSFDDVRDGFGNTNDGCDPLVLQAGPRLLPPCIDVS